MHMKQDNLSRLRRSIAISYVFMFFALFTVISGVFAYWYARKITQVDDVEVWLQAQALWVMRNIVIYAILVFLLHCGLFHSFSFIGIAHFGSPVVPLLVWYSH